jgi:hypothetical protein
MKNPPSLRSVLVLVPLLLAGGCSYRTGFAIINTTNQDITLSMTVDHQTRLELYTTPIQHLEETELWTRIDEWYPRDSTSEGEWKWAMTLKPNTVLISPSMNKMLDDDNLSDFPLTSLTLRGPSGTVYLKGPVVSTAFKKKSAGWYQFTYK